MAYLVLGISLLAALLLAARWYVGADVRTVKKVLLAAAIIAAVVAAGVFLRFGNWFLIGMLLPLLLGIFLRARGAYRAARNFSRMTGGFQGGGTGQTSDVETRFLRMGLDHDTGEVWGEVVDGPFAGRRLDDLTFLERIDLLRQCWAEDENSARVLEAYLDRVHPDWRERAAGGGAGADDEPARPGAMTRAQALAILGLTEGASKQEIKAAYQRIISGLHPDHGGSDYLAAQVNEAKAVLLGK